jgi:arylsulfatase A-like enzyme
MNGIFVACGPDIAKGQALDNPNIVDVAPTLLHLLGLPVPAHMDGQVLRQAFAEGSRAANVDVTYEQTNGSHHSETAGYTAEQEEKVKERLRQLGYLS